MNKPEEQWGGKDTYMTPHARRIPSSGLEEIETSESSGAHRLRSNPDGIERTDGTLHCPRINHHSTCCFCFRPLVPSASVY